MKVVVFVFCLLFLRRLWSPLSICAVASFDQECPCSTFPSHCWTYLLLPSIITMRMPYLLDGCLVSVRVAMKWTLSLLVRLRWSSLLSRHSYVVWTARGNRATRFMTRIPATSKQQTLSIERLGFHTAHHCTHIIFSFFQLYSPSGSFLTCLRLPLLGPVFWNIMLLFVHVISLSKLYLVVLVKDLIAGWLPTAN